MCTLFARSATLPEQGDLKWNMLICFMLFLGFAGYKLEDWGSREFEIDPTERRVSLRLSALSCILSGILVVSLILPIL